MPSQSMPNDDMVILSDGELEHLPCPFEEPEQPTTCETNLSCTLHNELQNLQRNFDEGPKEKLKVDKDSKFNPAKKLRIVYTGQPAVDTGGVMRQFYTELLAQIAKTFFEGEEYCIPVYNSSTVASGLMKLVGTIVVHSILQGGPGLPIFSPGIYNYLAGGNVDETIKCLTIIDCSLQMRNFIKKASFFFKK